MSNRRIKPVITSRARSLRSNMTDVEQSLWRVLRGGQINGHRFRRQHPIGKYIADFACIEKKIVIELDGGQHQERSEYDAKRSKWMKSQGWRILRFWNNDVMNNLDGVLVVVVENLTSTPPSQPSP